MKKTEFRQHENGSIDVLEDERLAFTFSPALVERAVDQFAEAGGFLSVPPFVAVEADWTIRRSLAARACCHRNVWDEPVIALRPLVKEVVQELAEKYGIWRYGEFVAWKNYLSQADESEVASHTAYLSGDSLTNILPELNHDPNPDQRRWQRNGYDLSGQRQRNLC